MNPLPPMMATMSASTSLIILRGPCHEEISCIADGNFDGCNFENSKPQKNSIDGDAPSSCCSAQHDERPPMMHHQQSSIASNNIEHGIPKQIAPSISLAHGTNNTCASIKSRSILCVANNNKIITNNKQAIKIHSNMDGLDAAFADAFSQP